MAMHAAPVWQRAATLSALTIDEHREWYYAGKRFVDFILSTLALAVLSPLMGLIALAIKLDSRGPVFFVQERVGARRRSEHGRTTWEVRGFRFYKFRTMVPEADPSLHVEHVRKFVRGQLKPGSEGAAKFKLAHDPRTTRLGRILRRTSLDELPQLFNVWKGDMSLVGPRPVPLYEVAEYRPSDLDRLAAWPGLTGLWQVNGRTDVSFADMLRMDREYVRTQSLWLDFRILLATIPAVVSGRGAR